MRLFFYVHIFTLSTYETVGKDVKALLKHLLIVMFIMRIVNNNNFSLYTWLYRESFQRHIKRLTYS